MKEKNNKIVKISYKMAMDKMDQKMHIKRLTEKMDFQMFGSSNDHDQLKSNHC